MVTCRKVNKQLHKRKSDPSWIQNSKEGRQMAKTQRPVPSGGVINDNQELFYVLVIQTTTFYSRKQIPLHTYNTFSILETLKITIFKILADNTANQFQNFLLFNGFLDPARASPRAMVPVLGPYLGPYFGPSPHDPSHDPCPRVNQQLGPWALGNALFHASADAF